MAEPSPAPTILALTGDMFLIPRLEDAAAELGFHLEVGPAGDEVLAGNDMAGVPPLTEPLEGADAALVRSIVADPPALILVDLASQAVPWRRWIQSLKTSSATRRFPIVAFGPHVEERALEEARGLGADRVVTRGELQKHMADILRSEARPPDLEAIRAGCNLPMSDDVRQGLAAFADGHYFEAHEHLERAVLAEPGPEGSAYRALLHLAVACLHTERGNWRGAQKMLLRMRPWLAPLPDVCRSVDVTSLRQALEELQGKLDRWRDTSESPPSPLEPPQIRLRPTVSS